MKFRDWLANWGLSSLKVSLGFLDAEWQPDDRDRRAACDVPDDARDPEGARARCGTVCAVGGRGAQPDRATVHGEVALDLGGAFADGARCAEFRRQLAALQLRLADYSRALADLAGVEDLTGLEGS